MKSTSTYGSPVYQRTSTTTNKVAFVVVIAIMLLAMIGGTLVFTWPANMEADYEGFGLLGAFMPVVYILGAFVIGIAATKFESSF